jgi:hypothetical protein
MDRQSFRRSTFENTIGEVRVPDCIRMREGGWLHLRNSRLFEFVEWCLSPKAQTRFFS